MVVQKFGRDHSQDEVGKRDTHKYVLLFPKNTLGYQGLIYPIIFYNMSTRKILSAVLASTLVGSSLLPGITQAAIDF